MKNTSYCPINGKEKFRKNNYNANIPHGEVGRAHQTRIKYTWEFLEVFGKGTLKHQGDPKDADITAE